MNNTTAKNDPELLRAIRPIIFEKGLKATTMDIVAQRLRMSKRTLYEIFDSKNDMILHVLEFNEEIMRTKMGELLRESPNVIVALIRIFRFHRDILEKINIDFFRDMDRLYPELREKHQNCNESRQKVSIKIFDMGVEQGVFRPDVNFQIMLKMMEIQSEALKRVEALFPPDITLLEIYDTITLGFLRSIASEKGHAILDEIMQNETETGKISDIRSNNQGENQCV